MQEWASRVLVISGRSLLAHGIKSLLEENARVSRVEIIEGYYDALRYAQAHPPDSIVLDIPEGSDYFVDRPIVVNGREVKTIVLQENSGQTRLYLHLPGQAANLQNLLSALLRKEETTEHGGPSIDSLKAPAPDTNKP